MRFKQISMSIGMKYSKYFTLLLAEDGTVWGTGSNFFGQLGNGGCEDILSPVQVGELCDIIAVEAGNLHSVALTNDGTVMGFGLNIGNSLGGLQIGSNSIPTPIPELCGYKITNIAAAGDFTFALADDNTLHIFGGGGVQTRQNIKRIYAGANESYAQTIDGDFLRLENGKDDMAVPELSNLDVLHISMGNTHTAVLTRQGTVLCCGDNSNGQLGLLNAESSEKFIDMGLSGITQIAAGGSHTLALNEHGDVFVWGFNFFGQLGDGTGERRLEPQVLRSLPAAEFIASGTFNSMIIAKNGEVYGWGSEDFGQLGDLTHSQIRTSARIEGVSEVKAAGAGLYHSAVLTENGELYIAGCNLYGQLGDGTNNIGRHTLLPLLDGIMEIEVGGTHTLAMNSSGDIWAWGNNACGQLGNGRADVNMDGKLGGGEKKNEPFPIRLTIPAMSQMAAGENHTLFLDSNGEVYAVGLNNCGQLGDGTRHNRSTPYKIDGLNDIHEIHAHKFRSAALDKNGRLYCWGYNANGELGTGDTESRLTPQFIMEDVEKVIMGGWYTLAVKKDATVWAFGMNMDGQFGDGTNKGSLSPREVTSFYGEFKDIAAGGFHTVVLKPNGTVYTCGKNEFGELGGGTPRSRNVLSPVPGLSNIKTISAGWFCVFAINENGELYAFGRNNFGQLCNPDTNRHQPVKMQI